MTAHVSSPAQRGAAAPARSPAASRYTGRVLLAAGNTQGAHVRAVRVVGLVIGLVLLVLAAIASIAYGSKPIAVREVFGAIWAFDASNDHLIVRSLRIPRTLVGLGVGAGLGLAGAVMQGVTRNPLADPGILGVNAGASLAVVVAIHVFGIASLTGYVWFAFAGAAITSVAVYALANAGRGGATPIKLALGGAAFSALLASVTTAILLIDIETLDQYRFWVVGSIAGRDAAVVSQVAPFLVAGALVALGTARSLNSLSLGEDVARSLGLRIGVVRAVAATAVVLLCGSATAAAGPITFVGLTVPHVARAICGPDYRWILPYSAVYAPALLLTADVVGRLVARPAELQVGIVTALVGAPFFIALVRRRRLAQL